LAAGLKLYSALRQTRQALQKEQDQSPAPLGGVTMHPSTPAPALPALQGFLSTEWKKKNLLQIAVSFLLLYTVLAPNTASSDPPLCLVPFIFVPTEGQVWK